MESLAGPCDHRHQAAGHDPGLKLKHLFFVFLPHEASPALNAYEQDRMPSTFVIDPKGIVRLVEYGYDKGDEDKLAAKLDELTKE